MKPVDLESQETTINIYAIDKYATLYTCEPKVLKYMDELSERDPDNVKIVKADEYSKKYRFPKDYFLLPRPPRKLTLTEEQRQARRERMNKARASKSILTPF